MARDGLQSREYPELRQQMTLSKEMRLLQNKWRSGQSWPKRLEWIEIDGIRGWEGQRVEFDFPIVAIVGENGAGKTTVLQAVTATYRTDAPGEINKFASDYFPDTPWEAVRGATIRASVREGSRSIITTVRKPTDRWRGNPTRPVRSTNYIDLRRIQPISARTGYARLAKPQIRLKSQDDFDSTTLSRLSHIMGKTYDIGGFSTTEMDETRKVPVLTKDGRAFSGFHGGAGETAMAELVPNPMKKYSMVVIDEVETSLHPRVQRRLVRDLANLCRENETQVILTTHSPYVLAELPPDARIYIMNSSAGRRIIKGVSPDFAMSQMDEEYHPEADLYVEDGRAGDLLREILVATDADLVGRVQIIPFGAASVGLALGQMINRFPRPSLVFLDGDQVPGPGCHVLPGGDAPERVVFEGLSAIDWAELDRRLGRPIAEVIDALTASMTLADHHEWLNHAANRLIVGTSVLWQAMCSVWAHDCAKPDQIDPIAELIKIRLDS